MFLLLLMTTAVAATDASAPPGFDPQCTSADDHGWPRFDDFAALEADQPWADYFKYIYGELPSVYPVCTFDLHAIDAMAVASFQLNKTGQLPTPKLPSDELKDGDLFQGGQMGYQIFHTTWKPVPANGWVEVTHTILPSELMSYWAWRQKGSGVWFNVGETMVFPTPADPSKTHAAAIEFLVANCSVQISPHGQQWSRTSSANAHARRASTASNLSLRPVPNRGAVRSPRAHRARARQPRWGQGLRRGSAFEDGVARRLFANRTCECEDKPIAPHCGMILPPSSSCTSMPGGSCSPPLCQTWPCVFRNPPCYDTWCTKRFRAGRTYTMGHRNHALEAATMAKIAGVDHDHDHM